MQNSNILHSVRKELAIKNQNKEKLHTIFPYKNNFKKNRKCLLQTK
jgi:hypothetical protein